MAKTSVTARQKKKERMVSQYAAKRAELKRVLSDPATTDEQFYAAQRKLTAQVMGRKGVTGTAVGRDGGRPCLKVYVSGASAKSGLPGSVDGFPVVVEISGKIERL